MTMTTFILWVLVASVGWTPVRSFQDYDLCFATMERVRESSLCLPVGKEPWQYTPPATIAKWPGQPRLEEAI